MVDEMIDYLSDFAEWLLTLVTWVFELLIGFVVDLIQWLVGVLVSIAMTILNVLPEATPIQPPGEVYSSFLGIINWFLPINHINTSLMMYTAAIGLYFVTAPILRWIKVMK